MVDKARAGRMAKRIHSIVATAIERRVKDRRLELITITDCRVTGDLHDATVYYTVRGRTLDEEPDLGQAAEALKRARGQLRKIVGDELGVRFTPTLSFEYDAMPESSAHLTSVLERALARDAELAELKRNARFAGDENPYKTADEDN